VSKIETQQVNFYEYKDQISQMWRNPWTTKC